MKKNIFFYVISILVLVGSILSCDSVNSTENNSNHTEALAFSKIDNYMKYLSADLADAKGLTISQNSSSTNSRAVSDRVSKNYLMKTDDLENINLKPVTFSKNNTITEDVYDEEGNVIDSNTTITQEDISGQVNKLYVYGNFIFVQFVPVKTDDVTLSEILLKECEENIYTKEKGYSDLYAGSYHNMYDPPDLRRFYISGKYEGKYFSKSIENFEILNPEHKNYISYGEPYGYSFNQRNFSSGILSKSYIIEKNTGYIYKIPDFKDVFNIKDYYDASIYQDTITINYTDSVDGQGYSYTFLFSIDDAELKIKRISVTGFPFKDKYGNRFSLRSELSGMDTENNILHIRDGFVVTSDERVIILNLMENQLCRELKIYKENFSVSDLSFDDNFWFMYDSLYDGNIIYDKEIKVLNGAIYDYGSVFDDDESCYNIFFGKYLNGECVMSRKIPKGFVANKNFWYYGNSWGDNYLLPSFIHLFIMDDETAANEKGKEHVYKFYYIDIEDILSDEFESRLKPVLYNGSPYESYDCEYFKTMDFSGITEYKPNLTTDENGNLIPCVTLERDTNFEQVVSEITVQPLN